jgi:hypothetical protein
VVGIGVNHLEFSEKNVGQVLRSKNLLVQEHACSKSRMFVDIRFVRVIVYGCVYVLDAHRQQAAHSRGAQRG